MKTFLLLASLLFIIPCFAGVNSNSDAASTWVQKSFVAVQSSAMQCPKECDEICMFGKCWCACGD